MKAAFPFLGHGIGAGNGVRLWIALARRSDSAEPVQAALAEWAKKFRVRPHVEVEGPIVRLGGTGFKSLAKRGELEAAHDALDKALAKAHAKTPLALVVRDNKTTLDEWHQQTLADAGTIIAALRTLIDDGDDYVVAGSPVAPGGHGDLRELYLFTARWRLQPMLLELVLSILRRGKAQQRAVIDDLLLEQLPSLRDRDFDCDVMLREAEGAILGLAAQGIKMSARFDAEANRRLQEQHQQANAAASWMRKGKGVDWKDIGAVRAAMAQKAWVPLANGLDDADLAHGKTLAALSGDERLALVAHGDFPRLVANAAVHFVMQGDFEEALALYDAAVEGELPFNCAANPLYAVQDDNHHLGVDEKRSRRYLERCLPHAQRNPTVLVNASFVYMELGEHDAAVNALRTAKELGEAVKQHRHEGLFMPLRDRADFKKLMR